MSRRGEGEVRKVVIVEGNFITSRSISSTLRLPNESNNFITKLPQKSN